LLHRCVRYRDRGTHPPPQRSGHARPRRPCGLRKRLLQWYVLGVLVLIYIMGTVDRAVLSVIASAEVAFHLSDKADRRANGTAYSVTYALAVLPMACPFSAPICLSLREIATSAAPQ